MFLPRASSNLPLAARYQGPAGIVVHGSVDTSQICFVEGFEWLTSEFLSLQPDLCFVTSLFLLGEQPASASRSGEPGAKCDGERRSERLRTKLYAVAALLGAIFRSRAGMSRKWPATPTRWTWFSRASSITITENHIKQLHGVLLKYSSTDQEHRGHYKKAGSAFVSLPALSRQILELAKTRGEITVKEVEESTGANRNTIKVHLRKLASDNYLLQVGMGRGARYTLK